MVGFTTIEVDLGHTIVEQEVPDDWQEEQVQEYVNGVNWDNVLQEEKINMGLESKARVEEKVARGIRNNNPGNIRKSHEAWEGLSKEQPDEEFFKFESPEMGIRAMAKTLTTYQTKHGLKTIEEIVGRWAPENENDTAAYAKFVADRVGLDPTSEVDLSEPSVMKGVMKAMIFMENGGDPYEDDKILRGLDMAGIKEKEQPKQTSDSGFSLISSANASERGTEAPSREGSMLAGLVPSTYRAFASDLLGIDEGEIRNEDYFSDSELESIKAIVKRRIKSTGSNNGSVSYTKGYKNGFKGVTFKEGIEAAKGEQNIKTTLGQFKYRVNDKGETIVTDKYDFNDAAELQDKFPKLKDKIRHLKEYSEQPDTGKYGVVRRFAALFGSRETPEEGARFEINLGKLGD